MPFPFSAVLFDMDGTITDSTHFHNQAWIDFVYAHLGEKVSMDDPRFVPGRTKEMLPSILKRPIHADEADFLHDDKELRFQALAKEKMTLMVGVLDYLTALKAAHIPCALVSNAPRINIDFAIGELALAPFFTFSLGSEDVKEGKPSPEPFLEACRKLAVDPKKVLIHEDSAIGIASGLAAGAHVAAVLSSLSAAEAHALGAQSAFEHYHDWLLQCDLLKETI